MDVLNHLFWTLIVSISISMFTFIVGSFVYKRKKIVGEFSASIFVLSFALMFLPLLQTDLTGHAIKPVNEISVQGETTAEIQFNINSSLQKVYSKIKGCDGISAYGYNDFLQPNEPIRTIIHAEKSPGKYNCTFQLCKSPFCKNPIDEKRMLVKVN